MNKNNLAGLLTGIIVGCIIVCIIMYFQDSYKKISLDCKQVYTLDIRNLDPSLSEERPVYIDSRVCTNFDTSKFLY